MDGSPALRFGPFELQARHRRLLRDGEPLPVGARAFDVLLALAERRERIVTKAELMDLAWPGLVVEENNLQVQISSLRKLLGSDAIATIPGRGYRFTAQLAGTRRAARSIKQRLAAIMAADVAGYSRLMGARRKRHGDRVGRGARGVQDPDRIDPAAASSTWPAIRCWRYSRRRPEPSQRRLQFKTSSEASSPRFPKTGACCFASGFTSVTSSRRPTARFTATE